MTAGLYTQFRIVRDYVGTDSYGQAVVVSGTILHDTLFGRIDYGMPKTYHADQQGIETSRQATIIIKPVEIKAIAEDKIYIIKPANHPDYLRVFRIEGVENTSINPGDRRGFFTINAVRTEEMRSGSYSLNG